MHYLYISIVSIRSLCKSETTSFATAKSRCVNGVKFTSCNFTTFGNSAFSLLISCKLNRGWYSRHGKYVNIRIPWEKLKGRPLNNKWQHERKRFSNYMLAETSFRRSSCFGAVPSQTGWTDLNCFSIRFLYTSFGIWIVLTITFVSIAVPDLISCMKCIICLPLAPPGK